MHEVMTIKSRDSSELTIGKRNIEKLAGFVVAVLALILLISMRYSPLPLTTVRVVVVLPAVVAVWGLHIALSGHYFTFTPHSQICLCHIWVFGIFRLRRTIGFSAVAYSWEYNWQTLGRLYLIVLVNQEQSRKRVNILGYVSDEVQAVKLAETISEFTGCHMSMRTRDARAREGK